MYEPTLFRMLRPEAQRKELGKTSQKQKNKGQASKDGWDAYTSEITLFLKTEWMFFKKLKIALPYDPAIPFLGICQKLLKVGNQRDNYALISTVALFIGSQKVKVTQMFISG